MIKEYHHKDFLPIDNLVAIKKRQNVSISIIVPALNEAKTIGPIIQEIKTRLMVEQPLVDEIIVMDGDSNDNTSVLAGQAGATVFNTNAVLAERGLPVGKGSSLLKSMVVSHGDIAVFVDGDISNFDARFVYGLIGPLVTDPSLLFVKAYYNRPLIIDNTTHEHEGGRVTEILARPFLATFFPDLAGLYQPLAGEYALRRDCIRNLHFSSGYSVEIGMLIDVWKNFGLQAFAQVDMERRCHRNRSLSELGRMSFAILQTLCRKLEQYDMLNINTSVHRQMPDLRHGAGVNIPIDEVDLPSLVELI